MVDLDYTEQGRLALCTSDTNGCYRRPVMLCQYRPCHASPVKREVPRHRYRGPNAISPRTIQAVCEHEVEFGIVTLASLETGLSVLLFRRRDVLIRLPQDALVNRKEM